MRHIFADGSYAGNKLRAGLTGKGSWTLEIIKRSDMAKGFQILPRRWVVERTLAWPGRCRRLARTSKLQSQAPSPGCSSRVSEQLPVASQELDPKKDRFESDS
jgi:transposase